MMNERSSTDLLSNAAEHSLEKLNEWRRNSSALEAFREAASDDATWESAKVNPHGFLLGRNVSVPDDIQVVFLDTDARQTGLLRSADEGVAPGETSYDLLQA